MATESYVTQPFCIESTMKRYVSFWTINGWRAYLKKEERRPLEQRLQTGQLSWKLKLACNLDFVRKPEWVGLAVLAELDRTGFSGLADLEPVMVMAHGCCSLLGLESKAAVSPSFQSLLQAGKHRAILMNIPTKDAFATQQLDEIKIRIEFVITVIVGGTAPSQSLAIERMTPLSKEVFDLATTDMVIVVDGKVIPVRQSVLADSSPIFKSQLKVETWKRRDLPDLNFQTAKELVKFAYTKREPNFQRMATSAVFDLMIAAEKYGLEKLRKHTVDHIASNKDPEKTIDFLLVADSSGNLSNLDPQDDRSTPFPEL